MVFYFSGATVYGIFLIYRMFQDRECSKTDMTSWTIIALASMFWIVVIPISIIELRSKIKAKNKDKHTNLAQKNKSEAKSINSPLTDY